MPTRLILPNARLTDGIFGLPLISAAYTDVLYFMVIPQPDFTLSYDPKLTRAQGEKLVTEFVAEARKSTFP
jgi:hypothetical protein